MRELENEFTAGSGTTDDYNMGHRENSAEQGAASEIRGAEQSETPAINPAGYGEAPEMRGAEQSEASAINPAGYGEASQISGAKQCEAPEAAAWENQEIRMGVPVEESAAAGGVHVDGVGSGQQNGAWGQTDYYAYGQPQNAGTYTQNAPNDGTGNGWNQAYEAPQQKEKKGGNAAVKILKFAVMALTFGMIAGVTFAGSAYLFNQAVREDASEDSFENEEVLSGADLNIAETTEEIDSIASRTEGDADQSAKGAVTDVSEIVDQSMPSIVSITTIARTQVPSFFYGYEEYESEGCGSGIIISQDEENLYIATNNHVIEGAQTLTVVFADGSSVDARVKGTDPSSDLAVVSVALENIEDETKQEIRLAAFGDSSQLKIGQTAIAIGNALGYGQSVTMGVISALDREVTVTNESDGSSITNELVQTSAAINPGNSGGALLNDNGEVIGITSVKYAETSVEGMGYAIPAKTAIPIIRQLITRELVRGSDSAYLGVSGVDVTQSVSETYHMPQGVYVAQIVEGSSADSAGLMQGDIITKFDGRNVKSMDEVQDLMRYLPAGTKVEVIVQRAQNGEYVEQTIEVTLGSKN